MNAVAMMTPEPKYFANLRQVSMRRLVLSPSSFSLVFGEDSLKH
jgi:hypothetical protein